MKTVNIFTPTYYRFGKTKRAIESIIETIEQSENDVELYIGDNNTKLEDMRLWLKDLPAKHPKVNVFFSNKNVGKGAMINYLHSNTGSSDYFISIDSDMLSDEHDQYNWIDELVKLMEWGPAKNFGLFSTWQKVYNAHILDHVKERTEFLGHKIWYGAFNGVAGGCVIMRNEDFLKVGRYNLIDIYSGDDALLMRNVDQILGKYVGITETIRLVHQPNEKEELEYQQWKIDKCYGKIPYSNKGFWD